MSPHVDPLVTSDASYSDALDERMRAAAQAGVLLLATDFDGTVAPFRDDPSSVRPLAGAIEALVEASALPDTTVAVVSGRDLRTLAALSGAPEGVFLVGSHGGESTHPAVDGADSLSPQHREKLDQLAEVFTELLERHPQARIERKAAAVVWHTRGLPDAESARAMADAARWAQDRCGIEPMLGKNVVECAVLDVTKGRALAALASALQATAVVYFGDDVTDETVFTAFEHQPGALMVKVGPGSTRAGSRVDSPAAAVQALARLVELRSEVAKRRG